MTTSTSPIKPIVQDRTGIRGVRFALITLGVYVVAELAIWLAPEMEAFPNLYRGLVSGLATLLTFLLLSGWWIMFSGLSWTTRLLLPLAVIVPLAGLGYLTIRRVEPSSDMVPTIHWAYKPGFSARPPWLLTYIPSGDEARQAERDQHENEKKAGTVPAFVVDLGDPSKSPGWPRFFGPGNDGVGATVPLASNLSDREPVWKRTCGGGFASFAVVGNVIYTIEQTFDNEAVACYEADTGKPVWETKWPTKFTEAFGNGPRATPTVADGRVFAVGAKGHFVCLDAKTGEQKWEQNLLPNPDGDNLMWGMCGSPLVVDDLVIVTPGKQKDIEADQGVQAFDVKTGERRWAAGARQASYSSAKLATLANVRQVLIFDADGLSSYDLGGKGELWHFKFGNSNRINVAQPVLLGDDRIVLAMGYDQMGSRLIKVTHEGEQWKVEQEWASGSLKGRFTSPVEVNGYLYGLNEGPLVCVDVKTGKRQWLEGRFGQGQVIRVGETLVIQSELGDVVLVAADPKKYRELTRVKVFEENKNWNVPAFADGRLYLRNEKSMAALDLRP